MGYYDEDDNQFRRRKSQSKSGYFISGLIGSIIGALIVLLLTGNLTGGNGQNPITNQHSETSNLTRNVSLDVTTDVTKAVEKTADAVIGITNMQGSNFFNEHRHLAQVHTTKRYSNGVRILRRGRRRW